MKIILFLNFKKSENVLRVNVNITGIPKGLGPKHGMHVHQNAISVVSDDTAQGKIEF